ncbi:YkgJ family cysteine cluster protein [Silanimonas sp.]|jgi:Fe-S-cluster containining protein|uniref:YkgJ family cysteine cluster protein n=1 Tax=Silanimonas sp. TaxID=1929290 RepID=UPI0022BAF53E|nr:YkgJ family cysteine cluster protein [Silanimonas sp.]MCZ8167264.1 YkgJ family cysteine cluster protein [Silanimonas sp.]
MNAKRAGEAADCRHCDAVCCRLTVIVDAEDGIAEHLTELTDEGLTVMARDEDGWCVAIDGARMNCSIYDARPEVCRRFHMGGPYCEAIREDYYGRSDGRDIPLQLIGDAP